MHLLRSVITLFILLSFLHHSSVSSCSYLSTASTSHTFQPYQAACQAYTYLIHFSPAFLLIASHRRPLRWCSLFLLACLLFSGDIELNPGFANFTLCTLNIHSILHPLHSAALSDRIVSHHPDLFCLTETWINLKIPLHSPNLHAVLHLTTLFWAPLVSLLRAILLQSLVMILVFLYVNPSLSCLLLCPSFPHLNTLSYSQAASVLNLFLRYLSSTLIIFLF